MTKLLLLTTTLAFAAPALAAGPFGLPDHVQDGWRDTGCDEAFNVEIKNDEGKVLYLNNPTCPEHQGQSAEEASAEGPGDGDGGEGPGDGDGGEGPGDGDDGAGDDGAGDDDDSVDNGGNPCGGNGTGDEGNHHGQA